MKIENHSSLVNLDGYLKKSDESTSSRNVSSTAATASGESVQFSSKAKEITRIQRLLEGAPEIRQQKVEGIRQRIEEGSYYAKSEDVAEKMIRENLIDLMG